MLLNKLCLLLQWLPYKWYFQLIYLVYRWLITFYFFGWLIFSGVDWGSPEYFTFLTNWCFLVFNAYLILASLSVSVKLITVYFISKEVEGNFARNFEFKTKSPAGCCGYSDNNISWYQMFHWLFFILGNELAVVVSLLYWVLLYSGGNVDGANANTHLLNGLIALIDVWVCNIPIHTYHVIYVSMFGAVYAVFTGLYFVGTDGGFVYNVLDFGENLGQAVGTIFLTVFIVIPAVHFIIFYSLSKLRDVVLYLIFRKPSNTVYENEGDRTAKVREDQV